MRNFSLSSDTYVGLFIGAIANGIVYVAGLSYVNIRSEKQERPMRVALCHAWKMIGFAITLTVYLYLLDDNLQPSPDTTKKINQIFGYTMIAVSVVFVVLHLINEFRQRQGLLYNYKDCLDHDNAIANNYCKLFSKNEVIISRNPTVSAAGLWKSTENLLPRSKKNYTNYWTIILLLPKLHGAVIFHYFLLAMTLTASRGYIDWNLSKGIVVWIMALGSVIGCGLLRYVGNAKVYTISSSLAVMFLGVSYAFFNMENELIVIFLWLFFFTASVAISISDSCLMEIAKIRFNEGALAVGFFLEIIPIAVLQSTQRYAVELSGNGIYNEKYFLPVIISSIVILVLTSVLYQLFMPNTFGKSLLQIQNELLKYKKFFVFTFDEDVKLPVSRISTESAYIPNKIVNVFEDHEKNMSNSSPIDYSEVNYSNNERLPDPPVNRVKEFDYDLVVPKPPQVIPRINLANSTNKSFYGSQKNV